MTPLFRLLSGGILMMFLWLMACATPEEDTRSNGELTEQEQRAKAEKLAQEFIMLDGHIDIPYRLNTRMEDISKRTPGGDFDYPRSKAGGLNAPFMSIYIPASYQETGGAKEFADELIDMVNKFETDWPDKYAVATSVADVKKQFKEGKISLPLGMENGAPIEGKMENLQHFFERGIRYITLTHSKNNHICDSSYDEERKWNGLSPFGRKVVAEMNRLGIIIDVSHISDSTFYQVMELSKAPVWASHSSCRAFTPDWERNMSDDMIKLLAEKDGVICINFGSSFLKSEYLTQGTVNRQKIRKYQTENDLDRGSDEFMAYYSQFRKDNPIGTVVDVMDHIDHVVKLVGVDHVAFGSDFDGVMSLPKGLQDAGEFPNLIFEMLKRNYSDEDIRKICGENMLRVWSKAEAVAKELQKG